MRHAPPADLDALLELVRDEASFVSFLHALAADFAMDREILEANPDAYKYSSGPLGWESGTISDWLFTTDEISSSPLMVEECRNDNPWKRCARILLVAKIIE